MPRDQDMKGVRHAVIEYGKPEGLAGGSARPLVTLAIPAYNRPSFLSEALASVARQDPGFPFEVVVSDDGGTEDVRRVVENCGIRGVRFAANRPALGAVRNWNRCIELASAPWLTILHEDDLLYPWFLKQIGSLLHPGLAAVAVRCAQGVVPPNLKPPRRAARVRPYRRLWFLKSSMTPFPGVVFSRDLALRVGGFDPEMGGLADYDFWHRLAGAGRFEISRETAAFYRVSAGQWTEREWPDMLRRIHLLRLRIARAHLGSMPRTGRWIARFYTLRTARGYASRFAERPPALARALRFRRIPAAAIPSGWVWVFLKLLARIFDNAGAGETSSSTSQKQGTEISDCLSMTDPQPRQMRGPRLSSHRPSIVHDLRNHTSRFDGPAPG